MGKRGSGIFLNIASQALLSVGVLAALLPIWLLVTAATQDFAGVMQVPPAIVPGLHVIENLAQAWREADLGTLLANSLVVALGVTAGKILLGAGTAYATVFFRWRYGTVVFGIVFATLMLPLEVRIVPTYAVAADVLGPFKAIGHLLGIDRLWASLTGQTPDLSWNLLDSYVGLTVPLCATATGTLLYRQFFLTVPRDLVDAARLDGAGPLRFFWQMAMPLSMPNTMALAVVMFVDAWNQYLWPLLITTQRRHGTAMVAFHALIPTHYSDLPQWQVAAAGALLVMVPPVVLLFVAQRCLVSGLAGLER